MQDLSEYSNVTLFSAACEVGQGKYLPYLQAQESYGVLGSCENPYGKNIITCQNPYKGEFLAEVNGLQLDLPLNASVNRLPSYIPIVDKSTFFPSSDFVGITLSDILSSGVRLMHGTLHEKKIIIKRDNFLSDLCQNKKVILFLTGADTLIESVWYNRMDCNLYSEIEKKQFYAVTGFNFSVIGGECAFAQALNQKRSLFSSYLNEIHGFRSIPHVYALNYFHVSRWIEWFKRNPKVNCFVTNCQLQKSNYDVAQVVAIVKALLTRMPTIHAILQGFPLDRISEFGDSLLRIHFADKGAIKYAHSGVELNHDLKRNVLLLSNSKMSFETLAKHNIETKENFIEYAKSNCLRIAAA